MKTYTGVTCLDCAHVEVNADYTGMEQHQEEEVRSKRALLAMEGYRVVVDTEEVNEFSSERCGVCDTTLAGYRFGAVFIPVYAGA